VKASPQLDYSLPILPQRIPFSTPTAYQNVFHGLAGRDDYTNFQQQRVLDDKWFEQSQVENHGFGTTSPVKFSPNHDRLISLATEKKTEKKTKKRKSSKTGSEKDKRRKTKWNVEPMLGHMRNALSCIRLEKMSTTEVSRSFDIPTRTLRRYVNFSKNPADKLFYMEIEEEKKEEEEDQKEHDDDEAKNEEVDYEGEDDVPISWKPQTTVPMFSLYSDDKSTAGTPVVSPVVSTDSASADIDIPEISTADILDSSEFDSFDDFDTFSASTSDLFDCVEFDDLFQDFCEDILSSDVL